MTITPTAISPMVRVIDNSEAFRNDNESTVGDDPSFDAGELFIDLDEDGAFSDATPVANAPAGLYNGIACVPDVANCSDDLVSVFTNLEIVAGPLDASSLTVYVFPAQATIEAADIAFNGSVLTSIDEDFSVFQSADWIEISGSTDGANDGIYRISAGGVTSDGAAGAADTLLVDGVDAFSNELAGANVQIRLALNPESGVASMPTGSYVVQVSDAFGNVPPMGTLVSAESTGECEVPTPEAAMGSSNARTAFRAGVSVIASGANDPLIDDIVTISVTIPEDTGGSGNPNTFSFALQL